MRKNFPRRLLLLDRRVSEAVRGTDYLALSSQAPIGPSKPCIRYLVPYLGHRLISRWLLVNLGWLSAPLPLTTRYQGRAGQGCDEKPSTKLLHRGREDVIPSHNGQGAKGPAQGRQVDMAGIMEKLSSKPALVSQSRGINVQGLKKIYPGVPELLRVLVSQKPGAQDPLRSKRETGRITTNIRRATRVNDAET